MELQIINLYNIVCDKRMFACGNMIKLLRSVHTSARVWVRSRGTGNSTVIDRSVEGDPNTHTAAERESVQSHLNSGQQTLLTAHNRQRLEP